VLPRANSISLNCAFNTLLQAAVKTDDSPSSFSALSSASGPSGAAATSSKFDFSNFDIGAYRLFLKNPLVIYRRTKCS
jgi:hypothetical protein